MKKEPTEKQIAARKAFGDASRARQAARKQAEEIAQGPAPTTDEEDIKTLITHLKEANERIAALEKAQTGSPQPQQGVQAGSTGLVGTFEKFKVDPNYYPDPRERLYAEPRLQRFAFRDNYDLGYDVSVSQYKTIDGINTKEPKFTLKLVFKVYDDITGELTTKRFTALTGIFHEDPDAAMSIARDNGIEVEATSEKDFLDEMRYLRFRDWLLEAFFPTPPPPNENRREVVVGNKLVEIYEVNSSHTESMAGFFSKAPKKL